MDEPQAIDMAYIKPIRGPSCGPWNAYVLYYRNTHPTYRIRIFVDHNWDYNGEILHEFQEYVLDPAPPMDFNHVGPKDVEMGCPIPGPTTQEFRWKIYDAKIEP